jgi:hypothetical protein
MIDNLTTCPCERKSNACYVNEVEGTPIKTSQCYGCGFMSNTLMKEGEQFLAEQLEVLPELYKDLMWEDSEGKKWLPTVVNLPKQGMIFANGTNKDNWMWSAVKAVPVTEEEKHKYPIPGKKDQYYEWRMDMTTTQNYDKHDFIEALDYIGVFPEQ